MTRLIQKHMLALTLYDFEAYPVWEDYGDDDDILVALDAHTEPIDVFEGAYFCHAAFWFPDDTRVPGFIRISSGRVTTIGIWTSHQEFVVYSLLAPVRTPVGDTPQRFAARLGKELVQVFPMRYRCQIGAFRLVGVIDAGTTAGIPLPALS
ncbi:MAG: hypothetical protein RMJ55_17045 [Roseiflexaceae bacterium]|nr:hypothetical protein [Roseiflexaceae bacterium]